MARKAEEVARAHGLFFIVDGSVLDLSVVEPSKADALEHLRVHAGRERRPVRRGCLSDELAMATLRGPDMGLWVGDVPSPRPSTG